MKSLHRDLLLPALVVNLRDSPLVKKLANHYVRGEIFNISSAEGVSMLAESSGFMRI